MIKRRYSTAHRYPRKLAPMPFADRHPRLIVALAWIALGILIGAAEWFFMSAATGGAQ